MYTYLNKTRTSRNTNPVIYNALQASTGRKVIQRILRSATAREKGDELEAPSIVNDVLSSTGQPLKSDTQEFMESRFGHDFSDVRIHTGKQAEQSAQAINADAYTAGSDIVFGSEKYRPESTQGQRLIAHELAHVVQQSSGRNSQQPSRHSKTNRTNANVIRRQPASNPPAFPISGIKVLGDGYTKLSFARILTDCTGIPLSVNKSTGLLEVNMKVPALGKSGTAADILSTILNSPAGIVVDTLPRGTQTGAFNTAFPGFQEIHVKNIRTTAINNKIGTTPCDAVMHELVEAHEGRKAFLAAGKKGPASFNPAHGIAVGVETRIRQDMGLEPRNEKLASHLTPLGINRVGMRNKVYPLYLEAKVYGTQPNLSTQISLIECRNPNPVCDYWVRKTIVVPGLVQFKNQKQAQDVFNNHSQALNP